MQAVLDYLEQQFEIVNEKLDTIIDIGISNSRKLDAVLDGQREIISKLVQNSKSIEATRVELRHIQDSLSEISQGISDVATLVAAEGDQASMERLLLFDAEMIRDQDAAMLDVQAIFYRWLSADDGLVERLNGGDYDSELIDSIRADRSKIVALINSLSGPLFTVPSDVVAIDRRKDWSPAQTFASSSQLALDAEQMLAQLRTIATEKGRDELDYWRAFDRQKDAFEAGNAAAFPEVDPSVFEGLVNSDALAYIVRNYLSFVLALEPNVRDEIGFSDLKIIDEFIQNLVSARDEAKSIVWQTLSFSSKILGQWEGGLEGSFDGGHFLKTRRDSLYAYIFVPEGLYFADEIRDEDVAEKEISILSADLDEVSWLIENGAVYYERGLNRDFSSARIILQNLTRGQDWALKSTDDGYEWLEQRSAEEVRRYNLDALSDVMNLYRLRKAGELHAFTTEELNFLDEFTERPLLSITASDIQGFISLIKSDRELIQFALEEDLISSLLLRDSSEVDANGDRAGNSEPVARIRHFDYASGTKVATWRTTVLGATVSKTEVSYPYRCLALDIVPQSFYPDFLNRFDLEHSFPMDGTNGDYTGLRRRSGSIVVSNATIECYNKARELNREVHMPLLDGNFTGSDLYSVLVDPRIHSEEFVRSLSFKGHDAELWYRENRACKLVVRWNPEHADVEGVDLAIDVGVISEYVLGRLDSPRLYASTVLAAEAREDLFAPDGTPINLDRFQGECATSEDTLTYNFHPGRGFVVELGASHPPTVYRHGWRRTKSSNLELDPGFRSAVVNVLVDRLVERDKEQIERVGHRFRNDSYFVNQVYQAMRGKVSDADRDALKDAYNDPVTGGNHAFFVHPVFLQFARQERVDMNARHASEIANLTRNDGETQGDFEARRTYVLQRQNDSETVSEEMLRRDRANELLLRMPAIIRGFAEIGLGECLFSVPEYYPVLALSRERFFGLTLLEAVEILKNPTEYENYYGAFVTIKAVNARLNDSFERIPNFPPSPENWSFRNVNGAIDHAASEGFAHNAGCTPGLSSINDLEDYSRMMKSAGLTTD